MTNAMIWFWTFIILIAIYKHLKTMVYTFHSWLVTVKTVVCTWYFCRAKAFKCRFLEESGISWIVSQKHTSLSMKSYSKCCFTCWNCIHFSSKVSLIWGIIIWNKWPFHHQKKIGRFTYHFIVILKNRFSFLHPLTLLKRMSDQFIFNRS